MGWWPYFWSKDWWPTEWWPWQPDLRPSSAAGQTTDDGGRAPLRRRPDHYPDYNLQMDDSNVLFLIVAS